MNCWNLMLITGGQISNPRRERSAIRGKLDPARRPVLYENGQEPHVADQIAPRQSRLLGLRTRLRTNRADPVDRRPVTLLHNHTPDEMLAADELNGFPCRCDVRLPNLHAEQH